MQCHESFRGARLRRSNQKRGKQADEHERNQSRMDEQPFADLTSRARFANCDRRSGSPSEKQSGNNLRTQQFYEQTERQIEDQRRTPAPAADYDSVLSGVVELLDVARRASSTTLMTATHWEIGQRIVEHEQAGQKRAGYGE
jgi:hypothetical protein